jgi:hypothetical protein
MSGKADFFVIGSDDRPQDNRVIAMSISCRAELDVGERKFSTSLGLHEVMVLKQYLDQMSGGCTIRLNGGWPPGVRRFRTLTQDGLKREVERLAARVVPRKDMPPLECFTTYFPGTATEKLTRLHKIMGEMYAAWEKLMVKARARVPAITGYIHPEVAESMACGYITEQEIEEIYRLADPTGTQLSEVILPEVAYTPAPAMEASRNLDKVIAEANALAEADTAGDAIHDAFNRLTAAGFSTGMAGSLTALLEQAGSADKVADEAIISAVGGKAKLAAAKLALKG